MSREYSPKFEFTGSEIVQVVFDVADEISVLRDGRHIGTRPASGTTADELIRWMVGRELWRNHRHHA